MSLKIRNFHIFISQSVHRCGAGGSMGACHATGPGSIPGRDKFPVWGFFSGFFLTCKKNVRKLLSQQGPLTSFGRHNQHLIFALLEWLSVCLVWIVFNFCAVSEVALAMSRSLIRGALYVLVWSLWSRD